MADFMQYQLEQNGDPRMQRRRTQPAQPTGQVPFMPNGTPQPAPQQAPTQPSSPSSPGASSPAPAAPQPPAGMEGWVSYGSGGWLPPDHPEAQRIKAQQASNVQTQQNAATVAQPAAPAPQAPPPNPAMGQQGSVNAQGVYTAGQAPTQVYNPQQIQQFQAPNLDAINAPTQQLLQQLLANPQTMTPQVIEQLKGREQDAAALMERQTQGQLGANAAARGLSMNSPYMQGQLRGLADSTNRGLLSSYRDIDINAIGQNRQDMMQALGAGDQFQNSALQRAISAYQPTLAQGQEQRAENLAGQDSLMNRYQMQEGMLGQQSSSLQNAISGNRQFELGQGNLDLGRGQLALGHGQLGLQGQELRQRGSEFDQNLGFQREQFNYGKEQNEKQMQEAAGARSDANSRWADQQAMAYQQQQEQEWLQMMSILMGGGY